MTVSDISNDPVVETLLQDTHEEVDGLEGAAFMDLVTFRAKYDFGEDTHSRFLVHLRHAADKRNQDGRSDVLTGLVCLAGRDDRLLTPHQRRFVMDGLQDLNNPHDPEQARNLMVIATFIRSCPPLKEESS